MKGPPADSYGWRDLGLIHTANITGVAALANTNIYYLFGDIASDTWSKEYDLHLPPLAGTQPANRPTRVILYDDMGRGYDNTILRNMACICIFNDNKLFLLLSYLSTYMLLDSFNTIVNIDHMYSELQVKTMLCDLYLKFYEFINVSCSPCRRHLHLVRVWPSCYKHHDGNHCRNQ